MNSYVNEYGVTVLTNVPGLKKKPTSTKSLPYRRMPGHVLVEEFLVPNHGDISSLAKKAHISSVRLHKLIRGNDRIDNKMAERLAAYYNNDINYWLDLQARFERGESL